MSECFAKLPFRQVKLVKYIDNHQPFVVHQNASAEIGIWGQTGLSKRSGWWRGSVVRMSVCSRRTFPVLRLIHGWCVTTLWVRRPLWVNQLGQLSLPSLRGR